MEYKIRANNQKEAVEVYKTIRQIQQGKHNIAVNADSRKDAVRIYKEAKRVCDSKKVKDLSAEGNTSTRKYKYVYRAFKNKDEYDNLLKYHKFPNRQLYFSESKYDAEGYGQYIVKVDISSLKLYDRHTYPSGNRMSDKISGYDGVIYDYGEGRPFNCQIWNISKLNNCKVEDLGER